MSDWRQTTLGEVITLQRGHDLTEEQRTPGPIPVIGSAGQNGCHNVARAEGPGVTVGRSGASVGVVTYVQEAYWPHNTVLYVRDFKGNDPLFVANLLRTLPLAELNSGAAQPSLNRNFLYPIPVLVPSFDVQRRIASILGAYDDLIEVNRRRVALLESMGRGLFEEWFVRFRFPGHENVELIETPLGPLPQGWVSRPMVDVVQHAIGGTWGQDASTPKEDVQACIIRGTDFPGFRNGSFEKIPNRYVSSKILLTRAVRPNDIIVEISGGSKDQPVGRALHIASRLLANFHQPVVPASFCRLLRIAPERTSSHAVFWHLDAMYRNGRIDAYQTQSTGLRNFKFTVLLDNEMIVIPDRIVLSTFDAICERNAELRGILILQIEKLRISRDLLLPRLISGQLSVAAAERELLEAA